MGDDVALSRAIDDGVQSIVLRMDTPRAERKDVSLLLNRLHHIRWDLGDDGELHLAVSSDIPPAEQDPSSQFEALSKVLDAEELSVLVRAKMGIDVSETRDGYASRLRSKL